MASITIDDKRVIKALKNLAKSLDDMTPFFKDVADLELSRTKVSYLKEVGPDGKKWDEPFTLRRGGPGQVNTSFEDPWRYVVASNYHAAPPGFRFFDRASGDKVLRDTGTMFNSISRAYSKTYAVVGTNVEYAKKHQYGDGVKQRAFLGINQQTIDDINKLIKEYLEGSVK